MIPQRYYFRSFAPGSNPDPATYCPANGYILDEIPAPEYPIVVTPPSEEEIILIMKNEFPYMVSFGTTQSSSGKSVITVHDDEGTLIRTTTVNTNTQHTYYFSSDTLTDNFYIKIAPEIAGRTILTFLVNTVSGFTPQWPIVGAQFNTPNLTSLASAFYQISALKKVEFLCTLNSLTSFYRTFRETGITHFTFPASLPACTRTDEMFYWSAIYNCNFNSCSMPVLTTMGSMFYYTADLRVVTYNPYIPLCTGLATMFYSSGIRTLVLSPTFSTNTITISLANITQLCSNLETLTLPDFPSTYTITFSSAFRDCPKLRAITFRGFCQAGSVTSMFTNSINIEEMYFDKSLNVQLWGYGTSFNKVRTLMLPDSYENEILSLSNMLSLSELNCPNCVSTGQVLVSIYGFFLTNVTLPGVKTSRLNVGTTINVAGATYVDFDFANSVPTDVVTPIYTIIANCDATELNRIFTALPSVTAKSIDVRGNPGAATCDTSIATAKGWTVVIT